MISFREVSIVYPVAGFELVKKISESSYVQ
jgi:hypothetical protein